MLFSEPKIPQLFDERGDGEGVTPRFSALQRAENSSISRTGAICTISTHRFSALQRAENSSINLKLEDKNVFERVSVLFSEPKIPQYQRDAMPHRQHARFSALQRAENSSIDPTVGRLVEYPLVFQCSSASRKFLNRS